MINVSRDREIEFKNILRIEEDKHWKLVSFEGQKDKLCPLKDKKGRIESPVDL